jgi:epoxide hydrolase-like predicted phosphatase
MTMPKSIIFDYGRVIVGPVDPAAFDARMLALAREHGFEQGIDLWRHIYISRAWEDAKRGRIAHDAFWDDRLRALGLDTGDAQTVFKRRLFEHWGLLPGMRTLICKLNEHYRLAVLSNTARRNFSAYLSERRGLDHFDCVISSAEVGIAKPDPAIYRLALDRLGIAPGEALFVDDMPRNTRAAEELGIPTILFSGAEPLRAELERRGVL